jgi:hypothetical protein
MSLNKPTSVILLLIWCLFMGVTAISIGFGAAFPALNSIAQPFVCSNGHMQLLTSTSQPQPGVTYTAEQWQCVDNQTGQAHDVDGSMFLINGLIYGTLLFAIIMIWWWMITKRRARRVAERAAIDVSDTPAPLGAHATPLDSYELRELARRYKEGDFSEKEYQRKHKKILDNASSRADAMPMEMPQVPPATQSGSIDNIELQELKRMLDEGQLSNVEYWRKLDKITERSASQAKAALAATSSDMSAETNKMEIELAQLKKLRDEGLITQQDYDQKKAEILGRM